MLVGYNTNISYKDKIYHVQTEDSGTNNPVIVTLLYSKGAILASKKTSYAHIVGDPDLNEKVRKLMQEQHKGIVKELFTGKYTAEHKEEEEEEEKEKKIETETQITAVQEEKEEKIAQAGEPEMIETPEDPVKQTDDKTEAKKQLSKSLDDILLNYIMKREK